MREPLRLAALTAILGLSTAACAASPAEDFEATDQALTPACLETRACNAPSAPDVVDRGWRHFSSNLISALGARHRGRDMFYNPGQPQTIIAKFAYGPSDKDLEDEEVDIFVQRECGEGWEKVGSSLTSKEDRPNPTVEGVEDTGGRVYFTIPQARALGPGRHRVRLVVAGDHSWTDMFIDVVPQGTKVFVSDVDGTLTSSEYVEFVKMLTGDLPETHDGAPESLRALAAKGYRPLYLTARPEWLTQRTHDFLNARGFPPGIVHTTTNPLPTISGADRFKTDDLARMAQKGLAPTYGFGNKDTDEAAYRTVIPNAQNRIFFKYNAGRRIESYGDLLPGFNSLAPVCR